MFHSFLSFLLSLILLLLFRSFFLFLCFLYSLSLSFFLCFSSFLGMMTVMVATPQNRIHFSQSSQERSRTRLVWIRRTYRPWAPLSPLSRPGPLGPSPSARPAPVPARSELRPCPAPRCPPTPALTFTAPQTTLTAGLKLKTQMKVGYIYHNRDNFNWLHRYIFIFISMFCFGSEKEDGLNHSHSWLHANFW